MINMVNIVKAAVGCKDKEEMSEVTYTRAKRIRRKIKRTMKEVTRKRIKRG